MKKFQFAYMVLLFFTLFPYLCTVSALGDQRYDFLSGGLQITFPMNEFRYDPYSRGWRYVPPEGSWNTKHPIPILLYNHSTETWQFLEPGTILQYNPLEKKWEFLE